jgi:hypothetical protein
MAAVCGEFGGDNPRFGPLSKILDGQILDGNGRPNSQGYSCILPSSSSARAGKFNPGCDRCRSQ